MQLLFRIEWQVFLWFSAIFWHNSSIINRILCEIWWSNLKSKKIQRTQTKYLYSVQPAQARQRIFLGHRHSKAKKGPIRQWLYDFQWESEFIVHIHTNQIYSIQAAQKRKFFEHRKMEKIRLCEIWWSNLNVKKYNNKSFHFHSLVFRLLTTVTL